MFKLNNLSLLLLRLAISYIWLSSGISKLLSPDFINSFGGIIQGFAKSCSFPFYANFLNEYVVPHIQIFAQLIVWGEILTGASFLLGFPLILASLSGMFMNLNYFFVATSVPSQFLNIIMIVSQFACWSCGAGSIWGLEAKIRRSK